MNDNLQKLFTWEEIKEALQQMTPLKASDPNGFTDCFYQVYWEIIEDEACSTILNFLNGGVQCFYSR